MPVRSQIGEVRGVGPGAWCLALDTSSPTSALVIGRIGEVSPHASDVRLDGANHASADLHLRIAALAERAGLKLAELGALGCGRGPGTFSGSRVALATAKGLALALQVPLYGLSTLHAVAAGVDEALEQDAVLAVLDARRGQLYGQGFAGALVDQERTARCEPRRLHALSMAQCSDLETLLRACLEQLEERRVSANSPLLSLPRPVVRLVGPGARVQSWTSDDLDVVVVNAGPDTPNDAADLGVTATGLWSAFNIRILAPEDVLANLDVDYLRASYAELGLNVPRRPPARSPFVEAESRTAEDLERSAERR